MFHLLGLGLVAVLCFPDWLQSSVVALGVKGAIELPINGWSAIHALSTMGIVLVYPDMTLSQYWSLVVGWEVFEQCVAPCVFPSSAHRFLETPGDTLCDLLVAIPASLVVLFRHGS